MHEPIASSNRSTLQARVSSIHVHVGEHRIPIAYSCERNRYEVLEHKPVRGERTAKADVTFCGFEVGACAYSENLTRAIRRTVHVGMPVHASNWPERGTAQRELAAKRRIDARVE